LSVTTRALRGLRRAALFAIAVVAFVALATAEASADEPVEFEQPSGGACNPCQFHLDGSSRYVRIDTGVVIYSCADEFAVRLEHDGTGRMEWFGVSQGFPGCNTSNCIVMNSAWPIAGAEEVGPGQVEFPVHFCLRSPVTGAESECDVDIVATDLGIGGGYHFDSATICLGSVRVELEAETEPSEGVVAHHL